MPDQGVGRDGFLRSPEGEFVPCLSLGFWWLSAALVSLGLETPPSGLCLGLHVSFSLVCLPVSAPILSCIRTHFMGSGARPKSTWSPLQIFNYICKVSFSKYGHLYRSPGVRTQTHFFGGHYPTS